MTFLRSSLLLALALTLATPALADDGARRPHPPLKPGKAAGVSHAQEIKSGIALVAAGGVIVVVALVAGTGGESGPKAQSNLAPVASGTP
jgi:hypothetical protein